MVLNTVAMHISISHRFGKPLMCFQWATFHHDTWRWCSRPTRNQLPYFRASHCTMFQDVRSWFLYKPANFQTTFYQLHIVASSHQPTCIHNDIHSWRQSCTRRSYKSLCRCADCQGVGTEQPWPLKKISSVILIKWKTFCKCFQEAFYQCTIHGLFKAEKLVTAITTKPNRKRQQKKKKQPQLR